MNRGSQPMADSSLTWCRMLFSHTWYSYPHVLISRAAHPSHNVTGLSRPPMTGPSADPCCRFWKASLPWLCAVSCRNMQEAERLELNHQDIPAEALRDAIATGDAKDIPTGFQRLRSPRCSRQAPDVVQATLQAQLECLPMAYAAEFEGHLRDLRTLLGPDVWKRVQEGTAACLDPKSVGRTGRLIMTRWLCLLFLRCTTSWTLWNRTATVGP